MCEDNIVHVPMKAGDVLLCDNYRVLHGRDIFEGDRLHAVVVADPNPNPEPYPNPNPHPNPNQVSWFGDEKADVADTGGKPGDVLNNLLNTFLVGK